MKTKLIDALEKVCRECLAEIQLEGQTQNYSIAWFIENNISDLVEDFVYNELKQMGFEYVSSEALRALINSNELKSAEVQWEVVERFK